MQDVDSQERQLQERVRELQERRERIAPEALNGDEQAAVELEGVDAEIQEARGTLELADAARRELSRREAAYAEEERQRERERLRERYGELAGKRRKLESKAQKAVESLAQTLSELSSVDSEQRAIGNEAGIWRGHRADLLPVVRQWLAANLPQLETVPMNRGARAPLGEQSPLPAAAPSESELQERREQDARRRAAWNERRRAEQALRDLEDEVDRRRTLELRARGSDAQTQQDVDRELAEEFSDEYQRLRDDLESVTSEVA